MSLISSVKRNYNDFDTYSCHKNLKSKADIKCQIDSDLHDIIIMKYFFCLAMHFPVDMKTC